MNWLVNDVVGGVNDDVAGVIINFAITPAPPSLFIYFNFLFFNRQNNQALTESTSFLAGRLSTKAFNYCNFSINLTFPASLGSLCFIKK